MRMRVFRTMVTAASPTRGGRRLLSLLPPLVVATTMAALAQSGGPQGTIRLVALGDSLTAGYLLQPEEAFPAVLEATLRARGYDVEIVNAGVNGDTASEGLARLDAAAPEGTDGVTLELGANDMLRGTNPEVTRRALDAIVSRLAARGIPVLLTGMRSVPGREPSYVAAFEDIFPDLADRHGLVLYPYFLDGVGGVPSLNLFDGVHPSPAGIRRIVRGILPWAERFLASLVPPKPAPTRRRSVNGARQPAPPR